MKRCTDISAALALAILLVMVGCSKKQDTTAPAPAPKSAQQTLNMQEGQWEITTTFEMPGMPAGMAKPQTVTTCLSQKDSVPKDAAQTDCTVQDTKIEGNTVTWAVMCKDSSAKGKVTYAGSTFDGVIETIMKESGKDMTAKMTMKGKHLGPCPPK